MRWLSALLLGALLGCSAQPVTHDSPKSAAVTAASANPYPSTYKPQSSPPTLIRGATVLTGTGQRLDNADVLIVEGRIQAVGPGLTAPAGARVVDAKGRWVTPGLIDVHSHLGVYPSPQVRAHSDGNEATNPVTANVWAEHSIWPQDPGFTTARIGGITSMQILPGSANLMGGRSVVLKNAHATTYQGMKFPGAPQGLKMACGENPKRVYGSEGKFPETRMGNVAGYRAQWIEAQEYVRDQAEYERKVAAGEKDAKPVKRDLRLDTLAGVLKGEILVHQHCYRADEMAIVLDMADEFGYHVAAFHHASEAYKIANLLAEHKVCGAMWADWWGFKMESYDGIPENIALVDAAPGGCAIVHSDSEEGIQRLNQEAAKAMTAGRRAGLDIPPERAITWLTANPARALGILGQTGTLEAGKMADVVLWNRDPFSVYALTDLVLIDGVVQYDRSHPAPPESDFLLGQPAAPGVAQ
ncbi:MAG TPA: amidohydrolase family protein [Steroidobacteraceae bacterium]|nr:amidohydrolase family protein [Steroidobacteraceae bacterium]